MRTTCLINNYNYRTYVGQAVDSALQQSTPFDEIIVVDDGSTDDSVEFLTATYEAVPSVKVVTKPNGGQLSAFNVGLQHATGDLIFFLDADDRYRPDYLQAALEVYQTESADFVIAGVEYFGSDECERSNRVQRSLTRRNWGVSVIAALFDMRYLGGPTSSLSMRRQVADRLLPYPYEEEWRTRADDVLVFGASILRAQKFHLGCTLVEYRVHDANHHWGRQHGTMERLRHALAANQLREWYARATGYDVAHLPRLLHREFATIERPTLREWWFYQRLSITSALPLRLRFRQFFQMLRHYCRQRSISAPSCPGRKLDGTAQPQHAAASSPQRLAG